MIDEEFEFYRDEFTRHWFDRYFGITYHRAKRHRGWWSPLDIVWDVYRMVLAKIRYFDPEKSEFGPFMTVMVNQCFRQVMKSHYYYGRCCKTGRPKIVRFDDISINRSIGTDSFTTWPDLLAQMIADETEQNLRSILAKTHFPPCIKRLQWMLINGLSYYDILAKSNLTNRSLSTYLQEARRGLRAILHGIETGEPIPVPKPKRKIYIPKRTDPPYIFECVICGESVNVDPSTGDRRTRFCSKTCQKKHEKRKYKSINR